MSERSERTSYGEFRDCEWCEQEYWAAKPERKYCSRYCYTAKRWSVYDDRLVYWRRDYLAGDSYKTIADREGLPPNVVRGALQYAGVKPRKRWEKSAELGNLFYANWNA